MITITENKNYLVKLQKNGTILKVYKKLKNSLNCVATYDTKKEYYEQNENDLPIYIKELVIEYFNTLGRIESIKHLKPFNWQIKAYNGKESNYKYALYNDDLDLIYYFYDDLTDKETPAIIGKFAKAEYAETYNKQLPAERETLNGVQYVNKYATSANEFSRKFNIIHFNKDDAIEHFERFIDTCIDLFSYKTA